VLRDEVIDSAKAMGVVAFTGASWLNISFGQFITFVGGMYTLIVATEKFYKGAQWLLKKFKKPPEG